MVLSNFYDVVGFLLTTLSAIVVVTIGGFGYFLGITVVVFLLRIFSVLCAVKEGIREWTENWLRVMFNEDFFPENFNAVARRKP